MHISGLLAIESELFLGFSGGAGGKESNRQCRRCKRRGFNPWVGRSPGGGNGKPIQYSCLKNHHGQRSLEGYSLWSHKEWDTTKVTSHACRGVPYIFLVLTHCQIQGLQIHSLITQAAFLLPITTKNIVSHYIGCLFIASFAEAVLFDTIPLFIFAFVACAFTVTLRKSLPRPEIAKKSRNFFLIFCF